MKRDNDAEISLNARLPKTLHKQVQIHCAETGKHMRVFVIEAVTEALAKEKPRD